MKNLVVCAVMLVAGSALANKQVVLESGGTVKEVVSVYGKNAKVDHSKNQYSDAEWQAFGITNEAPYIIKDGAVWRNMTQGEKDAVDATLQQGALDKAVQDVDWDALMNALATLLNKPRQNVEDAFKAGVDPKKAKKDKE